MRRIVILHDAAAADGRPDASDTLLEAQAIGGALRDLGYDTTVLGADLDLGKLERALGTLSPDAVFNLVESLDGRGRLLHLAPALLESLAVPFSGCSATALAITSNKVLAKRALLDAAVPTPALFGGDDATGAWIVKSVFEHSSLGLDDDSIVSGRDAVRRAIARRRAELGGEWFAERYVPGRELNVALLALEGAPRVLPVAEMRFDGFPEGKPRIVGYAAKWEAASFEYRHTVRSFAVEEALAERAGSLALECWRLFDLDGYARVDFRVDAAGRLWVLEVNANPCLSPDAGFAAALDAAGIAYTAAVGALVDEALRRAARAAEGVDA